MGEWNISSNGGKWTWEVSRGWLGQRIKRGPSSDTRQKWICTPWCTSSTHDSYILSSFWPSSSFQIVANQVLCWSCGYIPHVCRYEQWWWHRNATKFPGFMKSLSMCNDTHYEWDRHISHSSKPCSNNCEALGITWGAAGICTSCLAMAKLSAMYLVTEYGPWLLLYLREWSFPTICCCGT